MTIASQQTDRIEEAIPGRADVAVIGGGPAGSSTATALARANLSVVIVERMEQPRLRVGETLPPSIRLELDKLGVWEEFQRAGHLPSVGNRSVWGSARPFDNDFIFNPYGSGWHLDRQRFDEMLLNAARSSGAKVLAGMSLTGAEHSPERGWQLEMECASGRAVIEARFVVDASGRASAFARLRGVKRCSLDKLVGIVGYLDAGLDRPTGARITMVEAVRDGWWYSALLPDGKLVVVYMTDTDIAAVQKLREQEQWMALLKETRYTRERVESHNYELETALHIVSANTSKLDTIAGDGWLAAGDAAASYDPLSSQGISTALSTGISAAKSVRDYLNGEPETLKSYVDSLEKDFATYIQNRRAYYAMEKRWPDSIFWRRRIDPPGALATESATAS
jgi:flavin-dependent dehydrogenase